MTAVEPQVDGRTARSARTRGLVLDAMLELIREGDLMPSAGRVAARAAIAPRTVYLHFADMESLFIELGTRELDRLLAMRDEVPPDLPQEERIERFCASRALLLEALLPVMRAARLRAHLSPAIQATWDTYVDVSDADVSSVFARELDPLPPAARARMMAALFIAAGPAWESLRRDRRLSVAECTACMQQTVTALLGS